MIVIVTARTNPFYHTLRRVPHPPHSSEWQVVWCCRSLGMEHAFNIHASYRPLFKAHRITEAAARSDIFVLGHRI